MEGQGEIYSLPKVLQMITRQQPVTKLGQSDFRVCIANPRSSSNCQVFGGVTSLLVPSIVSLSWNSVLVIYLLAFCPIAEGN